MTSSPRRARTARLAGSLLLGLAAAAAAAQSSSYKVVSPDGKVTYTDRPPASSEQGRVVTINGRSAPAAPDAELPFELREAANKYPVTLYVPSGACEPCEAGRLMLRRRGVPYAERLVSTPEDGEALEKLSGAREAPTVTIGSQVVRGYSADLWGSYLDAAGYPRESKLPSSYAYKPATPLVERATPNARAAAPTPAAPPAPALPPPNPGGFKF